MNINGWPHRRLPEMAEGATAGWPVFLGGSIGPRSERRNIETKILFYLSSK